MNDAHPSETGGSGERIPRGRYNKPGDMPDNRRECYQCGFITNDDTDVESDSIDSPGLVKATTTVSLTLDKNKLPQPLKSVAQFNASSKPVTEMTVVDGCPFCGSTNRKGRMRSRDSFARNVDISNL